MRPMTFATRASSTVSIGAANSATCRSRRTNFCTFVTGSIHGLPSLNRGILIAFGLNTWITPLSVLWSPLVRAPRFQPVIPTLGSLAIIYFAHPFGSSHISSSPRGSSSTASSDSAARCMLLPEIW